jgi:hypothetical protein
MTAIIRYLRLTDGKGSQIVRLIEGQPVGSLIAVVVSVDVRKD